MTAPNQSEEIFNYIKANPGVSTEGIVSGTGWNRHLVEVAVKLMVEEGLIRETGKTEWGDPKFERLTAAKVIEEVTRDVNNFIGKINQNLQISTTSKLLDTSPFEKAAIALSGFSFLSSSPFSGFIANALDREQLVTEIAVLANITTDEVKDFYQSHNYSLEFIRAAIQAGAKLDKEDIKRTMEERAEYTYHPSEYWNGLSFNEGVTAISTSESEGHIFIVTLPDNDRREVKAAYMEVDGGSLYFEDEDHDTILAFGPGHWVWAERAEGESDQNT